MQTLRFDLEDRYDRKIAWFYSMFFEDHNFTNYFRFNFHKVSNGVYRSSQPTMKKLEELKNKYGIKTVINLKSENRKSAYFLFEEEKCRKLGLKLINVNIRSREMLTTKELLEYKRIMEEEMENPTLIHCKAGADRTGIFCTLYQYFIEKRDIKDTNQLKFLPFGHVKYSKAGRSDYYFEQFTKYKQDNPNIDLITWSREVANLKKMKEEFKINFLANFLNDKILRRE